MQWLLIIILIIIIFMVYVLVSLSEIKHRLNLISKHFYIQEETDQENLSNEEIEKILEDNNK